MTWPQAIRNFMDYLKLERGLSEHTQKAYAQDLKSLAQWAEGIEPTAMNQEAARHFIQHVAKQGRSANSQSRMRSTLRMFYRFLVDEVEGLINPMEGIEAPMKPSYLPVFLTEAEMQCLFDAIERGAPGGERDHAMLETMYASGIRVSELIELRIRDLDLDNKVMRVIGKGDKQRLLPLHDEAVRVLKHYLLQVRAHGKVQPDFSDHIFLNQRGGRLSRVSVFKRLKQLVERAGIEKNISPHSIRHSFATHLVQNGADIRMVQVLLGHVSITSTEIYTHLEQKQLEDTMKRYHPQANR